MSRNDEVLKSLELYIRNAEGYGIDSIVQLPIEIVKNTVIVKESKQCFKVS
jgi:hypothetical protein